MLQHRNPPLGEYGNEAMANPLELMRDPRGGWKSFGRRWPKTSSQSDPLAPMAKKVECGEKDAQHGV